MEMVWWHWMALGLSLVMAELFLAGFFIIWFGLAALLVGLVVLAVPDLELTTQVLIWTFLSVVMTVAWFKFFRSDNKTRSGQADEALGEIGILIRAIETMGRGEVRFQKPVMGSDVWPCLSDDAIAAGERVRVVSVDGQLLKVSKS